MKVFLVLALTTLAWASIDDDQAWKDWKNKFGYENIFFDTESEIKAYGNFKENELKVNVHNAKVDRTFDLGLNEFSIFDEKTFASIYCGTKKPFDNIRENQARSKIPPGMLGNFTADNVPKFVDNRNFQTPIQHQQKCGSCWAFATAAGIENLISIRRGSLSKVISQEWFVDCDLSNNGCHGGWHDRAALFAMENTKAPCSSAYPYDPPTDGSSRNSCKNIEEDLINLDISNVYFPGASTTKQIQVLVANYGAVVASIWGTSNFQSYSSGTLDDDLCANFKECNDGVNHSILIVGYNDEEKYWIVKNSWGDKWGESGYVKMKFDTCNINCYPMVIT